MIRAVNAENQHSEKVLLSEIVVYPPWWKSTWAYLLYILAGIGVIFLVFHNQLHRQLKKREADNLRALDDIKNQLFTNITHEFRTPLTIITGMIDQVEKKPERWLGEGAEMIRKNSNNLLDLVNQILELQKLESDNLQTKKQLGDIVSFLETIFKQFQAFAQSKEQTMTYKAETKELFMDFDPEKTLRILSNLLSNAIKYTPEKGVITCTIAVKPWPGDKPEKGLQLTVTDSGPGIPADQLPHIFDRFFQAGDNSGKDRRGNRDWTFPNQGPGRVTWRANFGK